MSDEGEYVSNVGVLLKPLHFWLEKTSVSSETDEFEFDFDVRTNDSIDCLICSDNLRNQKEFFQHLVLEHNLVIDKPKFIAHLKRYAEYWKKRFRDVAYTELCSPIILNGHGDDTDSKSELYLLSDSIEEDRSLRERLKRKRLEFVLEQHDRERRDDRFDRACIFCKKNFTGNRLELFKHMNVDHYLSVGQPDNIVFVDKFLDLLEEKIEKNLQCLLCESVFEDRSTLKEHMRKKAHKRLNPKNKEYDKFYLINYLELDKNWEEIEAEDDTEIRENGDEIEEMWGDYQDKEMGSVCLFCEFNSIDVKLLLGHMKETHHFDMEDVKRKQKLTYYQQVKLINYIRRQIVQVGCFSCLHHFKNQQNLLKHLADTKHAAFVPDKSIWDQPQYLFPTYENDNLLCAIQDDHNEEQCEPYLEMQQAASAPSDFVVVSEEVGFYEDSILWSEFLRNQLY